jgi:hypothetical protein
MGDCSVGALAFSVEPSGAAPLSLRRVVLPALEGPAGVLDEQATVAARPTTAADIATAENVLYMGIAEKSPN